MLTWLVLALFMTATCELSNTTVNKFLATQKFPESALYAHAGEVVVRMKRGYTDWIPLAQNVSQLQQDFPILALRVVAHDQPTHQMVAGSLSLNDSLMGHLEGQAYRQVVQSAPVYVKDDPGDDEFVGNTTHQMQSGRMFGFRGHSHNLGSTRILNFDNVGHFLTIYHDFSRLPVHGL